MKNIDWEGIANIILAMLIAAFAAAGMFVVYVLAVIVDNFKWILLCGTALLIASWYL